MNVAVLENPRPRHLLPEADVDMPLPPLDHEYSPQDFIQHLHQQAAAVRRGDVTVGTFRAFWEVAKQITYHDDGITETYHTPDGRELTGADRDAAALLCNMRSAEAWALSEETPRGVPGAGLEHQKLAIDDIRFVCDVFRRYSGICELDITADELDDLDMARRRLCATLGIADPIAYSLDQLIEKAHARLALHEAIVAGHFDDLFPYAVPPRHAATEPEALEEQLLPVTSLNHHFTVGAAAQAGVGMEMPQSRPEPVARAAAGWQAFDDTATLEGEIMWGTESRWPVDSAAPLRRRSGVIRSHRYRPERRGRVRRWVLRFAVAIAAAALAATLHPLAGGLQKPAAGPAPTGPVPTPEVPKNNQPPVLEPEPQEMLLPPTDYYMSLGGAYDPAARTGAIWFNVEDYAAQLGYSNLTLTQIHKLTDQCIQYMNTKLPGGMSWDKALHLSPDAQLPYPPADVMNSWIRNVINEPESALL